MAALAHELQRHSEGWLAVPVRLRGVSLGSGIEIRRVTAPDVQTGMTFGSVPTANTFDPAVQIKGDKREER